MFLGDGRSWRSLRRKESVRRQLGMGITTGDCVRFLKGFYSLYVTVNFSMKIRDLCETEL